MSLSFEEAAEIVNRLSDRIGALIFRYHDRPAASSPATSPNRCTMAIENRELGLP